MHTNSLSKYLNWAFNFGETVTVQPHIVRFRTVRRSLQSSELGSALRFRLVVVFVDSTQSLKFMLSFVATVATHSE